MQDHLCLHNVDVRHEPHASKDSLGKIQQAEIDNSLRDLKICHRRLQIALGTLLEEYQILERLYYKGKNQHRGALFWKRVAEVRRFCSRVNGMHINDVVEVLRLSFFFENPSQSSKLPKGSWKHVPNNKTLLSVLKQLSACSALIEKMHARLVAAYRFFTLAIKSGAFLQLILTLVSIVSRMREISSELQDTLQVAIDITHRISSVVSMHTPMTAQLTQANVLMTQKPSFTSLSPHEESNTSPSLSLYMPPNAASTNHHEDPRIQAKQGAESTKRLIVGRKTPTEVPVKSKSMPKKPKKDKKPRSELDEIFGF